MEFEQIIVDYIKKTLIKEKIFASKTFICCMSFTPTALCINLCYLHLVTFSPACLPENTWKANKKIIMEGSLIISSTCNDNFYSILLYMFVLQPSKQFTSAFIDDGR